MIRSINRFADFLEMLKGELEIFKHPVSDLISSYGESYQNEATFILQKLEEFALGNGQTLLEVFFMYAEYTKGVVEEYQLFKKTGCYRHRDEADIKHLLDKQNFKLNYIYILTISTILNRSRYEVSLHYREMLRKYLGPKSQILEIGGGNYLDAMSASRYGRVSVYETNELSLPWQKLLGLDDQVSIRIADYEFNEFKQYDLVAMIELLEHVVNPAKYLRGAHAALKDEGFAYLTFAVRMPQIDHLYQFDSIEDCTNMVYEEGFKIKDEYCTISTYLPFAEEERWELAINPQYAVTYCCVVEKNRSPDVDQLLQTFSANLD